MNNVNHVNNVVAAAVAHGSPDRLFLLPTVRLSGRTDEPLSSPRPREVCRSSDLPPRTLFVRATGQSLYARERVEFSRHRDAHVGFLQTLLSARRRENDRRVAHLPQPNVFRRKVRITHTRILFYSLQTATPPVVTNYWKKNTRMDPAVLRVILYPWRSSCFPCEYLR